MVVPYVKTVTDQLTLALLQDKQAVNLQQREAAEAAGTSYDSGDDSDDDPATAGGGYHALEKATEFLVDFGRGKPGGGNKGSDAIYPNRCFTFDSVLFP